MKRCGANCLKEVAVPSLCHERSNRGGEWGNKRMEEPRNGVEGIPSKYGHYKYAKLQATLYTMMGLVEGSGVSHPCYEFSHGAEDVFECSLEAPGSKRKGTMQPTTRRGKPGNIAAHTKQVSNWSEVTNVSQHYAVSQHPQAPAGSLCHFKRSSICMCVK
jgi:hypothetical protein